MKNFREISSEINADIEDGIYDNFPTVKSEMGRIAQYFLIANYTSNIEISSRYLQTLEDNGYNLFN